MKRRSKVGGKTGKARPRKAATLRRSFSMKEPQSTIAGKKLEVARLNREPMRHFTSTQDWTVGELQALFDQAASLKFDPVQPLLQGRTLALLFLNRSLRTRASFQIGAAQLGATAIVLEPGNGVWGIEFDSGMIMDGKAEEHVVEVAKVLSRYCDLIAMRAFPGFKNWQYDREDPLIKALARHAEVPVITWRRSFIPARNWRWR